MSRLPFDIVRPSTGRGVGFGDWLEQYEQQAVRDQNGGELPSASANAAALNANTRWNISVPAWAERTDGQSLLPNFFARDASRCTYISLPLYLPALRGQACPYR